MASYSNKGFDGVVTMVDGAKSDTDSTQHLSGNAKKGCFVSQKMGIMLVVGVVCTAVITGLIGHFATKAGQDDCAPCATTTTTAATTEMPTTVSVTDTEAPGTDGPPIYSRLPRDLIPYHYNVRVQPDIYGDNATLFTTKGEVTIFFTCEVATNKITLNVRNLEVLSHTLVSISGPDAPNIEGDPEEDKEIEQLTFKLGGDLVISQNYSLSLSFIGPLSVDLGGIYLSHYQNDTDQRRYLVLTQFEAPYARKGFPCFDEPDLKATFNTTVLTKQPFHARSNTEQSDFTDGVDGGDGTNDWSEYVFETSPKMPPYLWAILVSDFESVDVTTHNKTQIKIWARPNAIQHGNYAADVAGHIQAWLEEYTGIDYTLSKQDHVAVPHFAFGAMENWGLIIYRERYLLYDENESTTRSKQWITFIIAHELAHMWFGNLVTCAWWDDIFVNEALASFFEYRSHPDAEPYWDEESSVLRETRFIWETDGLATSEPMYHNMSAELPASYDNIFHRQVYYKGPLIIRMIEHALTPDVLKRGLHEYLHKFEYGNAKVEDMWDVLNSTAGHTVDVPKTFDPYVKQMGYAMVKVERDGATPSTAKLTQSHFLYNSDSQPPPSIYNYKWSVPITYESSAATVETAIEWLVDESGNYDILPTEEDNWFVLNYHRQGYFRVDYDTELRDSIIAQLEKNHTVIDTVHRAQFLDDLFALAKAGKVDEVVALKATTYLDEEEEYLPWQAALAGTSYIGRMLRWTSSYGVFQDYLRQNYDNVYKRVGWDIKDDEPLRDKEACAAYHKNCTDTAETKFTAYLNDPSTNNIHPDLRPTVFCTGIKLGYPLDWDNLSRLYVDSDLDDFKSTIVTALACSKDQWVLKRYLQQSLNENGTFYEDRGDVATALASSSIGRGIIWNYLQSNWNTPLLTTSQKRSVLLSIAESANTQLMKDQVNTLKGSAGEGDQPTFNQALELIENNMNWMELNYDNVVRFFQDQTAPVP